MRTTHGGRLLVLLLVGTAPRSSDSDEAALAPGGSPIEGKLEVRVEPSGELYLNDADGRRGVRDLMVQNIAIVNVGSVPVTAELLEIVAVAAGEPLVISLVPFDLYEPTWSTYHSRYRSLGSRASEDSIFHFSRLLSDGASLAPGPELMPGAAILVLKQMLTFSEGWQTPDALEIRVAGSTEDGETVEATLEIEVCEHESENEYWLPLRGRWYVNSSSSVNSHHRIRPAHEFAIDLIQIGADGKSHRGVGAKHEDYHAFGADVHAVADGVVVRTVRDVPETALPTAGESRSAFAARVLGAMWREDPSGHLASGNLVTLEHAGGEFSTYVHLREGSVSVAKGDSVKRGQVIAQVGLTGDGFQPHLHFQLNRGPDPQYSRSLPIRFSNVRPVSFASTNDTQGRRLYMAGEFLETVE